MATGTTGAIVKTGEIVPVHQIADTAAGIPWLMTTSPSFTTSQPAFHRLSLTTTCPASKRNNLATLLGASGTCKLPELVVSDVLGLGLQVLDFTMSYMPTSVPCVPFPAPSPPQPPTMSVAPGTGNIPSPNSAIMASVDMTDDPVTKAVMDNVLGRLPTKKPKDTVRCDVCNLEFYSQAVLDSHLAGSKHQRKVKSADLMKTLEQTETGFERDEVSGVIRCIVCDVTVNSPQLLATHIAGNKHKQRAAKRAGDSSSAPPAKRPCPGVTGQESMQPAGIRNSNGGPPNLTHQPNNSSSLPKTGSSAGTSSLDIPDCVTKLEETKGGGKYLCNPCQAHCNSEQQLAQHLSSRKHQDKLSGRKPRRGGGWRGRRRPGFRGRPSGRARPSHTYTQPLSSNFVAGGALL